MFIKNVIDFINENLDDSKGISELSKLEEFIIGKDYKYTRYDLCIIAKNEKLKKILGNVDKEFFDMDNIGNISFALIEIHKYGENIFNDPQREILLKIKSGDMKARKKFIEENKGLVYKIANSYTEYGVEFDDIVSEGFIGLMKAIDNFDVERGFRFSTYAIYWIKCEIRKFIFSGSKVIRVPRHLETKIIKYRNIREDFVGKYGREPSPEEISELTEIPLKEVNFIIHVQMNVISLDAPVSDEADSNLEELLDSGDANPEDLYLKNELNPQMNFLIENSGLTPNEIKVIRYRYGFFGNHMTLEEVGDIMGVSRERIRQIEAKALRKLRRSSNLGRLIDFTSNPEKAKEYIKNIKKYKY